MMNGIAKTLPSRTPVVQGEANAAGLSTMDGKFHLRFVQTHPMPKLHSPDEDEVFGPILFEETIFFRKYDAASECWSLVPALNPAPEPEEAGPGADPDEVAARDALISLPPPELPTDRSTPYFDPFIHDGRMFMWAITPEWDQWRLALSAD
jgi:hypothetical protein